MGCKTTDTFTFSDSEGGPGEVGDVVALNTSADDSVVFAEDRRAIGVLLGPAASGQQVPVLRNGLGLVHLDGTDATANPGVPIWVSSATAGRGTVARPAYNAALVGYIVNNDDYDQALNPYVTAIVNPQTALSDAFSTRTVLGEQAEVNLAAAGGIAVGANATVAVGGEDAIAVGEEASAAAEGSIAIGSNAATDVTDDDSIALGRSATTTGPNQCIVGSGANPINLVRFIGTGGLLTLEADAAPAASTMGLRGVVDVGAGAVQALVELGAAGTGPGGGTERALFIDVGA